MLIFVTAKLPRVAAIALAMACTALESLQTVKDHDMTYQASDDDRYLHRLEADVPTFHDIENSKHRDADAQGLCSMPTCACYQKLAFRLFEIRQRTGFQGF